MQIDALSSGMMPQQTNFNSLQTQVDNAKFSEELKKVQTKAESLENQVKTSGTGAKSAALTPAQQAQEAQKDKKLKDACQGFEAMFLNIMYKEMRDTVPKDSLFGDSNADDIMHSMLDDQRMRQAAASGGIGLADMLYRQLKIEQAALPPSAVTKKR